jgi:putative transposase
VKLTVQVKLLPTAGQAVALLKTLERANEAANAISAIGWEAQTFKQFALHKLAYHPIRSDFDLSAQVVVRLIAKVADAYKLDTKRPRRFRSDGSIAFDERILRYKRDAVSIWTLDGRQTIPFVIGEHHRDLLAHQRGESDLVTRDGEWYLYATVDVQEPPTGEPMEWLGVDLGIINIAVSSDGTVYSGEAINAVRSRHAHLRAKIQKKGTRSARRLLKKRRRKEARFAAWVNHGISKEIVRVAQGTGRGIALEDLKGIRSRTTVRQSQRRTFSSWSFFQLRSFITYKAQRSGVAVVLVDPRNTSRTCPACGCIDKANRRSQSSFHCIGCGFAGPADLIAAGNIASRAGVMRPNGSCLTA